MLLTVGRLEMTGKLQLC